MTFKYLILAFFLIQSAHGTEITFDQTNFGVTFSPFVKIKEEVQPRPEPDTYVRANIKTMLQIVSTKFSNIILQQFGSVTEIQTHIPNDTYNKVSYADVYSCEEAALVNRNYHRSLKCTIEIHFTSSNKSSDSNQANILLALEAAKIANSIHSGTVPSIAFSTNPLDADIGNLTESIKYLENNIAPELDLKLGIILNCENLLTTQNDKINELLGIIDFVICKTIPNDTIFQVGAHKGFNILADKLLQYRHKILRVNTKPVVMAMSSWKNYGAKMWENKSEMGTFWQAANQWAKENEFPFYMIGAFDNPTNDKDTENDYSGWWKLRENSLINVFHGYEETVTGNLATGSASGRNIPYVYTLLLVNIIGVFTYI